MNFQNPRLLEVRIELLEMGQVVGKELLLAHGEHRLIAVQIVREIEHVVAAIHLPRHQVCVFNQSEEWNRLIGNVHPVVAALFIPKINLLERHMLHANIAYIVKQRYLKQPIMTSNDYELFYDLVGNLSITYSANAVMVKLGFTPKFTGTIEPSTT